MTTRSALRLKQLSCLRGPRQRRGRCHNRFARTTARAAAPEAPEDEVLVLKSGMADYYAVLQVDDDASTEEVKSAYRTLAKVCHPDFTGEEGHNLCILLNEAYEVLSTPSLRAAYNEQLEVALQDDSDGYTGKAISKWVPGIRPSWAKNTDPNESRAVFVDEQSCIGCKNCVHLAPATFRIEPWHGRSRVFAQWLNTEETLDTAILSCPVDCIHWVQRDELPALEYVAQQQQQRVDVSVMMAQRGVGGDDIFSATEKFKRDRKRLEEQRRRAADAVSPMQADARRKAEEAMAGSRRRFFGGLGSRVAQQMANAAAGYGRAANVATAAEGDGGDRARVGARRRARKWNAGLEYGRTAGGGGGGASSSGEAWTPIPVELSMVLSSSEDEWDWSSFEESSAGED